MACRAARRFTRAWGARSSDRPAGEDAAARGGTLLPLDDDQGTLIPYGGIHFPQVPFDRARVVVLPLPFDRTNGSATGTSSGPLAILTASAQLALWDEEMQCVAAHIGVCTLPAMHAWPADLDEAVAEIRRVAAWLITEGKFPVFLGGEHAITGPIVAAMAQRHSGLSVLHIGAHANLRDRHLGTPHHHRCAMRRALEFARATQVGIRSLSPEEAEAAPTLPTEIFYDFNMRADDRWIARIVDSLGEAVYVTISVDGLEPGTMPATPAPEPGGLSWYETIALLRSVAEMRLIVGCDVVELAPLRGFAAPDLLCAKLAYKLLAYRFGDDVRRR